MKTVGIDLSLIGTGIVVLDDNVMEEKILIRSKKIGDKPKHELTRLMAIVGDVAAVIERHKPDVIAIEGLAFAIRKTTSFAQLSALHYMVRAMFPEMPTIIVAPTTLKKFVTGKGNAPKDFMLMGVYKRWGITFFDDNLCDGYSLARVAQAVFDSNVKTTSFQKEVVTLIKKQL